MFLLTTSAQCLYTPGVTIDAIQEGEKVVLTTRDASGKMLRKIELARDEAETLTIKRS
nr:MAG: hypothetical protein [Bacteriophage sp.]